MSVVSVDDVRALVTTALTDPQLQDVIDREEADLALLLGAPLEGERTETFVLESGDQTERLQLSRRTDTVAIVDNGDTIADGEIRLIDGWLVRRIYPLGWHRGYWRGPVEATYTPNDLARVSKVIIGLVGLEVAGSDQDQQSENIGEYGYTARDTTTLTAERRRVLAPLFPRRSRGLSVHIPTSQSGDRRWLGTVAPVGPGS